MSGSAMLQYESHLKPSDEAHPECKHWCGPSTKPWSRKCKLGECKACAECEELREQEVTTETHSQCEHWCGRSRHPWSHKCKLGECKACSKCDALHEQDE